jgi:1-acyl-sn-glycerol-3-phosphate acyltransferase
MSFSRALLRLYHIPANWLSWAVFAFVGVGLNLVCAVLLLLPGRERRGPGVRAAIRRLFAAWCGWLHATRLIYVTWSGFTPEALAGPAVYIANHPGLLDATFLLARLPDAICIFKPAIMRNPALGPAAVMAGYISGDAGIDLVRDAAARVSSGRSLLVFPEGTRTVPGARLNPFKPGFALIASRAHVPIRLLLVRAPRDLVPKGWSWWRAPRFPAQVEITLVGELRAETGESATELTARAARQLSDALAAPR